MEREFNLYTIRKNSTFNIEQKGSKFIALSFNISSVEDADKIIADVKKEYPNCDHDAYAFVAHEDNKNEIIHYNTGGEPAKSAGYTIFEVIKDNDLTNTLVIIIRYFSGILLGYENLKAVYRNCTEEVLKLSGAKLLKFKTNYQDKYTLMSFTPKYADAIASGEKTVDYRHHIFKNEAASRIYIYECRPISSVIGYFTIDKIISGTPEEVWQQTSNMGFMNKDEFFNSYFVNCYIAYAVFIKDVYLFDKPKSLKEFNGDTRPPISFKYNVKKDY
ncbi:YigZ family protein [Fructilactobacillus sp. Tb1]|uniref:YigZ family protein n=1 Tax=Fructilactobacillus sp. Tb1 TaxID=3422304 RepID=UPI003D2A15DF